MPRRTVVIGRFAINDNPAQECVNFDKRSEQLQLSKGAERNGGQSRPAMFLGGGWVKPLGKVARSRHSHANTCHGGDFE
jgi:hypothetical protein